MQVDQLIISQILMIIKKEKITYIQYSKYVFEKDCFVTFASWGVFFVLIVLIYFFGQNHYFISNHIVPPTCTIVSHNFLKFGFLMYSINRIDFLNVSKNHTDQIINSWDIDLFIFCVSHMRGNMYSMNYRIVGYVSNK